jgi:hypothetical protein
VKWRDLGLLFDPARHDFGFGPGEFAQSPQALVLADRVRIFFSTRERDAEGGKFLSHVAFVDMDHGLERLLAVAERPVFSPGGLGCFDEHGIFPFSPVQDGNRVLAYTTGWSRRVSVPVETAIGLAISHDHGRTFERYGRGPVMAAAPNEPFLVCDAFVRRFEGCWHMWYIAGTSWRYFSGSAVPERTYKIVHATSDDGVVWRRNGLAIIADALGPDECQALPSVLRIGTRYHMVFCYRESVGFRTAAGRGYRLGYAWSDDLERWARDDAAVPEIGPANGWNGMMQCYPHLFECGARVFLLYNGNAFGRGGFGAAELELR